MFFLILSCTDTLNKLCSDEDILRVTGKSTLLRPLELMKCFNILFKNQGLSLVSVLVATAITGVLTAAIISIISTLFSYQVMIKNLDNEMSLKTEIRFLLSQEKHCRVSLAGNGSLNSPSNPVEFQKSNVDENSEGLDIELWTSNQMGTQRLEKFLSASDPKVNVYDTLKIKKIKLLFKNGVGSNYTQNPQHSDIAYLSVTVEKTHRSNTQDVNIQFPLNVWMKTDLNELTTILSCGTEMQSLNWNQPCPDNTSIKGFDSTGQRICSTLPKTLREAKSDCGSQFTAQWVGWKNSWKCTPKRTVATNPTTRSTTTKPTKTRSEAYSYCKRRGSNMSPKWQGWTNSWTCYNTGGNR